MIDSLISNVRLASFRHEMIRCCFAFRPAIICHLGSWRTRQWTVDTCIIYSGLKGLHCITIDGALAITNSTRNTFKSSCHWTRRRAVFTCSPTPTTV